MMEKQEIVVCLMIFVFVVGVVVGSLFVRMSSMRGAAKERSAGEPLIDENDLSSSLSVVKNTVRPLITELVKQTRNNDEWINEELEPFSTTYNGTNYYLEPHALTNEQMTELQTLFTNNTTTDEITWSIG